MPVKTSDIDPVIEVTSTPEAVGEDGVVTITMDQASAGRFQRARIEASSRSVAPLTISKICFINDNGGCVDSHIDGAFTLCAGTPETPNDCPAPEIPGPLRFDTNTVFSAFYRAPDTGGMQGADVVIESNAALNATYKIQLRGTPCARMQAGDICNRCGDGEVNDDETCDDGNLDETDACRNDCTAAECGDGLVHVGVEACDDGNLDNTDACTNECVSATCGDGVVQTDVEACDDGNKRHRCLSQ